MINIQKDSGLSAKIAFTHSLLPSYIDPQNVSTKKKPFSTFNAQHFSHTLDLVLPAEIYALVRERLESSQFELQYARVHMKLSDVLAGAFFTEYIKQGNIMMRSEGRSSIDNVITLYEGVLRLELDRATYERCGLQGKPVEDGGRKHMKGRWVVEFDLRAPSMLHGKKGFGRLEWAAKNVLDKSLTWLFYNANPGSRESLVEGKEPVSAHHPFVQTIGPGVATLGEVVGPRLTVGNLPEIYEQEDAMGLVEWIHLVALDSPRIRKGDRIDPFLARYDCPDFGHGTEVKDMMQVRWRGFVPPQFVRELFLAVRNEGLKVAKDDHDGEGGTEKSAESRWFALLTKGFDEEEAYTVMQWAGRETLTWELL